METRDFYVILGVGPEVGAQAMRAAYRQRVLGRPGGPGRAPEAASLGDLVDAYRVLSDRELRASYDEARGVPLAAQGTAGTASQPEPLVPDQHLALTRDFEAREPSVDEVLDRLLRNFTGRNVPKSERLEALDLTIGVSPELATFGGLIELAVPVFYPCPQCRGEGYDGSYACFACGRTGMVEDTEPVHLSVPPLTRDGSSFDIPLHGLGIENLYLRVHLRIGG
jgi:DnaJ-class molecular chaperone